MNMEQTHSERPGSPCLGPSFYPGSPGAEPRQQFLALNGGRGVSPFLPKASPTRTAQPQIPASAPQASANRDLNDQDQNGLGLHRGQCRVYRSAEQSFAPLRAEMVWGTWPGGQRTSPEPLLGLGPCPQSPLRLTLTELQTDRREPTVPFPDPSPPARKTQVEISYGQGLPRVPPTGKVMLGTLSSFERDDTRTTQTNQNTLAENAEKPPLLFLLLHWTSALNFAQEARCLSQEKTEPGEEGEAGISNAC